MVQNSVTSEPQSRARLLRDLPVGVIAVDASGKHYMRTSVGATCLSNGDTYTFGCGEWACCLEPDTNASRGPSLLVTPLRPGSKVTIVCG